MWIRIVSKNQIIDNSIVRNSIPDSDLTNPLTDEHDTLLITNSEPDILMNLFYYSGKKPTGTVNGHPYTYGSLHKNKEDLINESWLVWKDMADFKKIPLTIDGVSFSLWLEKTVSKRWIDVDFDNQSQKEENFEIFICYINKTDQDQELDIRVYERKGQDAIYNPESPYRDNIDNSIIKVLETEGLTIE